MSSLFAMIKQSSGTEIPHFKEILNDNPLNYKMDNFLFQYVSLG